jgi:hypothetical protein
MGHFFANVAQFRLFGIEPKADAVPPIPLQLSLNPSKDLAASHPSPTLANHPSNKLGSHLRTCILGSLCIDEPASRKTEKCQDKGCHIHPCTVQMMDTLQSMTCIIKIHVRGKLYSLWKN